LIQKSSIELMKYNVHEKIAVFLQEQFVECILQGNDGIINLVFDSFLKNLYKMPNYQAHQTNIPVKTLFY